MSYRSNTQADVVPCKQEHTHALNNHWLRITISNVLTRDVTVSCAAINRQTGYERSSSATPAKCIYVWGSALPSTTCRLQFSQHIHAITVD